MLCTKITWLLGKFLELHLSWTRVFAVLGIAFTLHGQEDSEWETLPSLFKNCLREIRVFAVQLQRTWNLTVRRAAGGGVGAGSYLWLCFLEECRGAAAAGEGSWGSSVARPALGHQNSSGSREPPVVSQLLCVYQLLAQTACGSTEEGDFGESLGKWLCHLCLCRTLVFIWRLLMKDLVEHSGFYCCADNWIPRVFPGLSLHDVCSIFPWLEWSVWRFLLCFGKTTFSLLSFSISFIDFDFCRKYFILTWSA